MKKIILTKGLPASGKSTWAKKFIAERTTDYGERWKRINKDDLRAMMDNSVWSKPNETFVKKVRDEIVKLALKDGYSIIIDDTNLDDSHEKRMNQIAVELGTIVGYDETDSPMYEPIAKVEVKDFTDVPLEVCIERDKKRADSVGKQVIMRMYNQFLKPKTPIVEFDSKLPIAIICDLDGTLALHNGRSPYDTDKCDNDLENLPILYILNSIKELEIIFVSGREDKFRDKTVKWLSNLGFAGKLLLMRKTDDMRNDAIVKKEIYDSEIKGKYNILFCLDDRDRVVNMWRELGLTCLQVADGSF
jgi:predicted kinase